MALTTHRYQFTNVHPGASACLCAQVPVPHFGVVLTVAQFHELSARLKAASVKFEIAPHLRFQGKPGEQWTM